MMTTVRIERGTGDLLGCVVVVPTPGRNPLDLLDDGPAVLTLPVRGGRLIWDAARPAPMPAAILEDPLAAADWTWWFWGAGAASGAYRAGVAGVEAEVAEVAGSGGAAAGGIPEPAVLPAAPACPDRADAALRLAHAAWLAAWWPASDLDDIPALDLQALAEEVAPLRAVVDGLLDDDAGSVEGSADDAGSADDGATTGLAGVRDRFALAAGTSNGGPTVAGEGTAPGVRRIAEGTCAVDWSAVPAGLVDASERAVRWTVDDDAGQRIVRVEVAAGAVVPGEADGREVFLLSEFGPATLTLARTADPYGRARWTGTATLPAGPTANADPATSDAPWPDPCVYLPGFAPPTSPAAGAALRETVRALVRERIDGARQDLVRPDAASRSAGPAAPGAGRPDEQPDEQPGPATPEAGRPDEQPGPATPDAGRPGPAPGALPPWEAERRAARADDSW